MEDQALTLDRTPLHLGFHDPRTMEARNTTTAMQVTEGFWFLYLPK
jgi:hypothetical protein